MTTYTFSIDNMVIATATIIDNQFALRFASQVANLLPENRDDVLLLINYGSDDISHLITGLDEKTILWVMKKGKIDKPVTKGPKALEAWVESIWWVMDRMTCDCSRRLFIKNSSDAKVLKFLKPLRYKGFSSWLTRLQKVKIYEKIEG